MATDNIEDLTDDEIEARQRAEDGETDDHNPTAGDDAATTADTAQATATAAADTAQATDADAKAGDATAAAATTGEAAAAPAAGAEPAKADGKADGKVDGVLSKDGTRVLPYHVVTAARRDARRAETRAERAEREAEQLRQQLADMKAGKTPDGDELTEEFVADMEANFPDQGKKYRAAFNRIQELEKQVPKATAQDAEPGDDPVQEAIDQIPLLLEWQHQDADKFNRAIEHDAVLMKSPKWADKPAVERFTEAARRTADEYDIAFPQAPKPNASTSTAAPAAPAQTAAQAAQRKPPETLSDFKGGSVADHGTIDVQKASPRALLAKMETWSNEEIDAHLAKYG